MGTIRLTTAQALIKFLNQQYIHVDGKEFPFVEGIFNVFGHGNVLGIGQALEQDPGHLKVIQGKNEQGMAHAAIAYSKQMLRQKYLPSPRRLDRGRPTWSRQRVQLFPIIFPSFCSLQIRLLPASLILFCSKWNMNIVRR